MNSFFDFVPCHRRPDRSFSLNGKPMPLCARCTSMLLGYLSLPFLMLFHVHIPLLFGLFLMGPLVIDGLTQKWKWRTSNNSLRFITGLLFGFGQSIFITITVWRLVDLLI